MTSDPPRVTALLRAWQHGRRLRWRDDGGRRLVRRFRFDRGDLVIWFDARGLAGEPVTRTLTWRRADR